ncbi:phospholipid carrier-dependent glycosyltransferase [Tsuneonella mangrovi]|uniref:phospholipid carrier-dependent glycosyltransferase n=1 Tax=Tsuneonella mangrovi TaxID=1982042 RepID=UPI001470D9FC|nr:phospholipid carrier-dependent glycosyltransferase [Tsuneonella mangrovi]
MRGLARLFADDRDPLVANLLICLAFFLLGLNRLYLPKILYFDETWYVNAALKLLAWKEVINREHPMLAKEMIAVSMILFGKSFGGIRLGSLILGTIGLFAFQRAHFKLTASARSTMIFGVLVAFNFLYFATSRMAILDPYMLGFAGIGSAFFVNGVMHDRRRLICFALAGFAMGCAMAAKWTAAPLYGFMGLATIVRFWRDPRLAIKLLVAFGGISVATYFLTFLPIFFIDKNPLPIAEILPLQRMMTFSLGLYIGGHPYASHWWDWPIGRGQMWIYNGFFTGKDMMIVLGQNPVATLISLPAVAISLFLLPAKRDWRLGAPALLYLFTFAFWIASGKPVQFLYHYNLSSIVALSVAAQLAAKIPPRIGRIAIPSLLTVYLAAFAFFYPVITAASIGTKQERYTSLPGWEVHPPKVGDRRPVGNGWELMLWSQDCLVHPAEQKCARARKNTVQP